MQPLLQSEEAQCHQEEATEAKTTTKQLTHLILLVVARVKSKLLGPEDDSARAKYPLRGTLGRRSEVSDNLWAVRKGTSRIRVQGSGAYGSGYQDLGLSLVVNEGVRHSSCRKLRGPFLRFILITSKWQCL